ncbi:transporter substrate-binding protein [Heyndrickxia ginsengihumi]|uniref:transporter substrate-binding protein n=1 Tax=Heyndrickxia ginsengihumi TaxID=363870 RepID=UPI0004728725|nr:transporter substrate-binding protein [Heyndrickxia ginsengihumi]
MLKESIRIGFLFSLSGSTAVTERGQYQAAQLAIKQINKQGGVYGYPILSFVEDIVSDPLRTIEKAKKLIEQDKVHILIGTYTSACRKAILPLLEKQNVLLIYPTLYEGNEQNGWVFYSGALPNQQLQFFVPWITKNLGRDFYLVGSDYIFPKKTNQHMHKLVDVNSGKIVGESYRPLGNKNFEQIFIDIEHLQPDLIFSTLVGDSAIAFYEQLYQFGLNIPICSPITAETEIHAMKSITANNLYASFPYFKSIESEENRSFVRAYEKEYGSNVISSVMENSYNSIYLLYHALLKINQLHTDELREALAYSTFEAPQGFISFDHNNHHLWQQSRIGQVNDQRDFDIVWESEKPIAPLPFFSSMFKAHRQKYTNHINSQQMDISIVNKQLNTDKKEWKEYLPFIEKMAKLFPGDLLLFNNEGMLLKQFGTNELNTNIGSVWVFDEKGRNGFAEALISKHACIVEGHEHDDQTLHNYITIGVPMILEKNCIGVLGVVLGASNQIHLDAIVTMLELHRDLLVQLISEKKKISLFHDVIKQTMNHHEEGFLVLFKNEKIFGNDQAERLLNDVPFFIDAILRHLEEMNHTLSENHLRKRFGNKSFEIRLRKWNDFYFVYVKGLDTSKNIHIEKDQLSFQHIIGMEKGFLETVHIAKTAAVTDANVLIIGESGTGKELFANAIHNESARCKKPFIAINCGAIPKELIHSELFGYVDGAFTGSKKGGKKGLFAEANGGTIFLDEIGEMPLDLQVNLLRVLQEREINPIGASKPIPIDVRIIAATNKNLRDEIAYNGSFRSDLYYRLNVFQIELLPLRQRQADIPELVFHVLKKLNHKNNTNKRFSQQAMNILLQYHWPGNIRELNNVVERSYYLSGFQANIEADYIDAYIREQSEYPSASYVKEESTKIDVESVEKEQLLMHLNNTGYNISKVSRILGISRTTLYKKMRLYHINIKR